MHVEITYFKDSGKYYSEGRTEVDTLQFYSAVEIVKQMLDKGKRPGLVDGKEFHALVTIYTEHGPLPYLYIRK